ncbi:catalase family protein [Sorangium sp. So ce726]|uniref:catalase family protein n=1 Tax=Sorangium sp. So ce726 TaxID=3133319 RepID=UPI003F5F6F5A
MNSALDLHEEYPPPGEEDSIRQLTEIIKRGYERAYPAGASPALRGVHPKSHGCVRAHFVVDDGLPGALRHGVFREPRVYPAWVRFSSTSPRVQSDMKRDSRCMAIKLLDVQGEKVLDEEKSATTQDFLMANTDVFFARNVADYAELMSATSTGKPLSFFFSWCPPRLRLRELMNYLAVMRRPVKSPLLTRYWSQTPFRLGERAMKFSVVPRPCGAPPVEVEPGDDALKQAVARQLERGDWMFDFLVQLQTHPTRTPIEDPTIRWSEALSPFYKVATMVIPAQRLDPPGRAEFEENLSFSPWHALPAHRPLGGLNRARRAVYETISKLRHERNGARREEPTALPCVARARAAESAAGAAWMRVR